MDIFEEINQNGNANIQFCIMYTVAVLSLKLQQNKVARVSSGRNTINNWMSPQTNKMVVTTWRNWSGAKLEFRKYYRGIVDSNPPQERFIFSFCFRFHSLYDITSPWNWQFTAFDWSRWEIVFCWLSNKCAIGSDTGINQIWFAYRWNGNIVSVKRISYETSI